jgi:hypothetical protein
MQSQYEEQSTRMQMLFDEQAAKMAEQNTQLQEVLLQNHRFQEALLQRDAQSTAQASMFMSSMLRGQANEIRSRIRGYKDKQVQTARVQARLTASKTSTFSERAHVHCRCDGFVRLA